MPIFHKLILFFMVLMKVYNDSFGLQPDLRKGILK